MCVHLDVLQCIALGVVLFMHSLYCTHVSGWSPLHMSAGYGVLPLVEALIAAGADPNTTNSINWTPLLEACHKVCAIFNVHFIGSAMLLLGLTATVAASGACW
jgi:Ankyrin repeats (many copies)